MGAGRQLGVVLGVCCIAVWSGAWNAQAQSQEAFIGWRGETYLPPPRSPPAAAAAEAVAEQAVVPARRGDQALLTVEQLEDVHEADEPHPPVLASAAADAPSTAASQHTIDLSESCPTCGSQHNASASWVQLLSWHPRLHLHHNFLTHQECDAMRALLLRPSLNVGGSSKGRPEEEEAALQLMLSVEERLAQWASLPPEHVEGWQLQQGFPESDKTLHTDLLVDRLVTEDFQRIRSATVLLFLGEDENDSAAATSSSKNWSLVFPIARGGAWRGHAMPDEYHSILAQGQQVEKKLTTPRIGRRGPSNEVLKLHIDTHESLGSSSADGQGFCDGSIQAGLTLTGFKKGSALLIWNLLTDNQTPDASAAHLFCPGDNQGSQPWIATTWLHNMPFEPGSAMTFAAACEDRNPACSAWASKGFCDDAPSVMLGLRGMCRRSCEDCQSCDHLRPNQQGYQPGKGKPSVKAYMDCIYRNMHSLRQEWSEAARGAGVRKARNAIRRDLRFQAAHGISSGIETPSLQQSQWLNVW